MDEDPLDHFNIMNSDSETETQRVRRHTSRERLDKIDQQIERNIRFYGSQPEVVLTRRIEELDAEWSIERWLATNASILALGGASFGLLFNRKKWLLLTLAVSGFLLQHAVSGWCPPVPVLRGLGIRTQSEIDREKFALKALRGDFSKIEISERRAEIGRKRPKPVVA